MKSVKHHLYIIVGDHTLTIEEMSTLLCQVEASLNSRQISAISDNVDSFSYLNPGHFLTGYYFLSTSEPTFLNLTKNLLSRWELVQRLGEHFWKRWSLEYFQGLQNIGINGKINN